MLLYFNKGMCSVQQKTSKNNFNVAAEAGRLYLKARGFPRGSNEPPDLAIIIYIYIYNF